MTSVPQYITNFQASPNCRIHKASPTGGPSFVTSDASGSRHYMKQDGTASCTCRWAECQPKGKPFGCSHIRSAVAYRVEQWGYKIEARAESDNAVFLHRKMLVIDNGAQVSLSRDQ